LKISLLVAGHVVAGLFLAWLGYQGMWPDPVSVGVLGVIFAEAGLLGILGGFGTTQPFLRISVVFAATGYVCVLDEVAGVCWFAGAKTGKFLLVAALPTVGICLLLSGLRHGRGALHLARSIESQRRFRFSIRHLLMLTAGVAIVLGIPRPQSPLLQDKVLYA